MSGSPVSGHGASHCPQKPLVAADNGGMLEGPEIHAAYNKTQSEESRKEWLVAFDINCLNLGLDARQEWERLGGTYPGPSPEWLRMQSA